MTDSIDRSDASNKNELIQKRMEDYEVTPKSERTLAADIPQWVLTAFAYKDLMGATYKETAEKFGKAASTMQTWNVAPAVKDWRVRIREVAEDPAEVSRMIFGGSLAGINAHWLAAFFTANEVGNLDMIHKMAKEFNDRVPEGLKKKREATGPASITINLSGGDIADPILVDSEVVEDE